MAAGPAGGRDLRGPSLDEGRRRRGWSPIIPVGLPVRSVYIPSWSGESIPKGRGCLTESPSGPPVGQALDVGVLTHPTGPGGLHRSRGIESEVGVSRVMTEPLDPLTSLADRSLLLLDDDAPLRTRLGRALEQRGFDVVLTASVAEAVAEAVRRPPAFAVIDLKLEDGSGLKAVGAIREVRPEARIIMLTGYGNIATAVAAVKAGAIDYLAKPADADDVVRALMVQSGEAPVPPEKPMSADRVRWEHIQRVYELCDHNVSETARRLSMHRRTLQRILAKRAPR